jgi:hypothetical protein
LYETYVCMKLFNIASPNLGSEVGLIGRCIFLLPNCIKKEENGSHGNTRNLFSVSMRDNS